MSKFAQSLVRFLKVAEEKREYEGKTDNYVVERVSNAPKDADYRRKVVYDKDGYKHILTLAKVDGKWKVTSIWHEKSEPHARKASKNLEKL